MPRSNHPRGRRRDEPDDDFDVARVLAGWRRTETKRGVLWNVQPVSAVQATKEYVCPGCGLTIVPGTAHLVAWRAEGVRGEAVELADRRHWHNHCWKIG
ncbi:hypothetical protein [Compostimonas suwonensis]|uniref:ATP/GTP-binding protein n=1 Tax=Compostimonas suwonensis TaxID=1048394 RepID=A0A2M9BZR4_9MICO|nr:hypothetical protein [Compostimonas suwonensis]PJJ63572.1 hypothetical protein CLV54_1242 [Compostimonas suwonensis]